MVEYCEVEIEDARMEDDDVSSTPDHKGGLVCKCKLTLYFTYGSKRDEKVGAGIVSDSLTRGFRLPDHYSVYDAELFGVFAAIENILQEDEPAVIFSDSLSSLIAIKNGISTHPLVIKICNLLIVSPILIKLSYIPAHIGIQGNECTDSWGWSSLDYRTITPFPISHNTLMSITDSCIRRS